MSYERDEAMRKQEATEDMIRMRQKNPVRGLSESLRCLRCGTVDAFGPVSAEKAPARSARDRIMTSQRSDSEIKAYNLHVELQELLKRYDYLIKKADLGPTFGEDPSSVRASRALYDNRPNAEWEPQS